MAQQQNPLQILQRTSPWAIISLVASIASFFILPLAGSVIGIVAGDMARKEIRAGNGALGGENLAHLGVILGWVGVGVWALGIFCGGIALFMGLAPVAAGACGLLTKLLDYIK